MSELSRYGHRQRMRDSYLSGGMENAADHNLLELFLSLVIPQKDVKPIAYDLINTFGSLENVINANPIDLMKVNGIGESTAVALKLIKDINKRIALNRNKDAINIVSTKQAFDYCRNILGDDVVEKFAVITLTNDGTIINHHIIKTGTVKSAAIDIRNLVEYAIRDNAAGVIISHNHPNADSEPSANDINVTIELNSTLKKLDIALIDHIVVGKNDCTSMKSNPDLRLCLSR